MTVAATLEWPVISALSAGEDPAQDRMDDRSAVPATSGERGHGGHALHPARILIVDDEPLLREAFRDLLAARGFTVVGEAADGVEAVAAAAELEPDLVLMDVRMPNMDGMEASRRIKRARPGTRIVVLSAYEDASLRREGEEVGVHAFLVKGTPPDVIEGVILASLA